MRIHVAQVNGDQVQLSEVEVQSGATVEVALKIAGITPSQKHSLAVWNERCDLDRELIDGDRIEILPPLTVDPMTARRLREEKNKSQNHTLTMGPNGGKHRLF